MACIQKMLQAFQHPLNLARREGRFSRRTVPISCASFSIRERIGNSTLRSRVHPWFPEVEVF